MDDLNDNVKYLLSGNIEFIVLIFKKLDNEDVNDTLDNVDAFDVSVLFSKYGFNCCKTIKIVDYIQRFCLL